MNSTVKNTLRNIISRYGTELSRDPRLCAAYLADLLPNYPVERKHLVEAVAQGLPGKWIRSYAKHERERLTSAFARNCQLSAAEAAQVADAWLHALQQEVVVLSSKPPSTGRSMRVYMGGVATGLTALLVTSSIAFYQAPSEPINAGAAVAVTAAAPITVSTIAPEPVSELVSKRPEPEQPRSAPLVSIKPQSGALLLTPTADTPPVQLAAANGLGMVNREKMIMNDAVATAPIGDQGLLAEPALIQIEKSVVQAPLVVDYPFRWALAHPRPTMLSTRRDRPEQQKEASISKAIAIESARVVAKQEKKNLAPRQVKPKPVLETPATKIVVEVAKQVEKIERQPSRPPAPAPAPVRAPKAQLPPSPIASRQPAARQELESARRQQALMAYKQQASSLLSGVLQDSMAFGEKVLVLQKKQGDLSAVRELLQLTGDGFYREQLASVQQQMDSLQKSLDLLSAAYGKKLSSLCKMPIGSKDMALPTATGQLGASARRILDQHWKGCQNISGSSLKQELMRVYGGLRSN